MMSVELDEASTHEDIQTAVDEIVEARKGDGTKRDGQVIAEDRDKPVTEDIPAEEGSEDTADDGEETGESEDRAWLDEDLKAEVAAYGIDEKELADFTSREEVQRALRFFDRSALEAGRKVMAERDENGRFAKKEEEPKKKTQEGTFEVSLDKEVYDEQLVAEMTRMRDHYESRVAALEARFAEADERVEEDRFDALVDAMGHADLFGKSGKESAKELQRRRDLFVAAKAQRIGLQELGRAVDLDEALLGRVARMVFAEELGKKDLKAKTQKLQKQHNSRMGGGSVKSPGQAEDAREWAKRRYKELEGVG